MALWTIALFFVAAQFAFELTAVARGQPAADAPLWVFPLFASLIAALSVIPVVYRYRSRVRRAGLKPFLLTLVQIGCGAVAHTLNVFAVFATAFTVVSVIICWLFLLSSLGLLRNTVCDEMFYFDASILYASLRALTEVFVQRVSLPRRLGRLVPFVISSGETLGMMGYNSRWYKFDVQSDEFGVYATVKAAVFLCLPLLEEWMLGLCCTRSR